MKVIKEPKHMKPWLKILIAIFCVGIAFGVLFAIKFHKEPEIYIVNNSNHLQKEVGDCFNLVEECGLDVVDDNGNHVDNVMMHFASDNINFVTIELTSGDAECIAVGETFLVVNAGEKSKEITIDISAQHVYATHATFENETIQMIMNSTATNNFKHNGDNIDLYSTCSNNIVSYDLETGTISSFDSPGTATISCYIQSSPTEYAIYSFTVEVIDDTPPTQYVTMSLNSSKKILISQYLNGSNFILSNLQHDGLLIVSYAQEYVVISSTSVGTFTLSYLENTKVVFIIYIDVS